MFRKSILLALPLFVILAAAGGVMAQELSQGQILAGLSAKYRGINGLQAAYRRVASTPGADQIFQSGSSQVATGLLYWERPDKLLMEQASPDKETMVTDGRVVWWDIPSEQLVYRYSNIDVAGQLKPLMSFLGGLNSLNADFNVSPAPFDKTRPGQHGLILSPKGGPDGGVERLTIWCDGNFVITGFSMAAITGEITDFYLSGFTENPAMAKSLFSFKVPKGAQVIEEGEN